MEYNYFKNTMEQGSKLVATGSNKNEIKRFLLSRGIEATDYMVNDFIERAGK